MSHNMTQGKVFVELLTYIDNCGGNDGTSIFKFSKLHQMYEHRLQILGINKTLSATISFHQTQISNQLATRRDIENQQSTDTQLCC